MVIAVEMTWYLMYLKMACTIYKQVITPQLDYADFLIDSGSAYYVKRIGHLHEKALRLIDCKLHRNM